MNPTSATRYRYARSVERRKQQEKHERREGTLQRSLQANSRNFPYLRPVLASRTTNSSAHRSPVMSFVASLTPVGV
jgi:hypothetical protein